MTTPATEPTTDPQIADLTQQLAERNAQIVDLRARLDAAEQRVSYVEQEYRTLWRSVSEAANTMLAANHPLA